MDWISIEENDVKNLKRGDKIKVKSFPYSQKYLDMIDYDYYFPNYEGKIISSNHNSIYDLLIKVNHKTIQFENPAGTSAIMFFYYSH